MKILPCHRRAARAIWECGGRVDEAAGRYSLRPLTLRRWLTDPGFRRLLAEAAIEPLLQATSALFRWAPVAVARLIRDLDSESAADGRQAARELLRLALSAQRELAGAASDTQPADDDAPAPDDPFARQVAALSGDQLARVLAILNEPEGDAP